MLQDFLEIPVQVRQFQGRWLHLTTDDCSRVPSARRPEGQNCQLGTNVVVGRRVWSVENKFRVRLGPLGYAEFRQFMPRQNALRPLCQLIRCSVGPEFDFDVQPVLQAEEVPQCRAGSGGAVRSQLGWNTWIHSQPMRRDAGDAIFEHEGRPE
jgi:type VI secretion system protein ImpH